MQGHDAYLDRSANSQSAHDNGSTATTVGTAVSALEPYVPPNVPHGLPHVVRYATLSSMDLPLEVRFLIIIIARFANVHGVASVANSTLCEICRIGSHHTESPEILTRDTYLTPDSGTGTHPVRHLCYPALPCRADPRQSVNSGLDYPICIPSLSKA